jgi:chromosome partitioning protein
MIVSFVSNKGGTGKTTACVNVAACLSKKEKRTLIIDLDPIASSTSSMGIKAEEVEEFSMQFVAKKEKKLEDIIFEIENLGIHIAPSHRGQLFHRIKKDFLSEDVNGIVKDYDFILIDTPPGFDEISREAMAASDVPIAALNESIFAVENLPLLREWSASMGKSVNCAILSVVNRRSRVSKGVIKTLSREFKHSFIVPFDKRVPESQALGLPLVYMGKRSNALKSYTRVADYLLEMR